MRAADMADSVEVRDALGRQRRQRHGYDGKKTRRSELKMAQSMTGKFRLMTARTRCRIDQNRSRSRCVGHKPNTAHPSPTSAFDPFSDAEADRRDNVLRHSRSPRGPANCKLAARSG
jgi:hypothetical protein